MCAKVKWVVMTRLAFVGPLVFLGLVTAAIASCVGDDPGTSSAEIADSGSNEDGATANVDAAPGNDADAACTATCGTQCTNLSIDPNHCGKCNHACAPSYACIEGSCSNEV